MKQCGLRSSALSPSAQPFTIGPSSSSLSLKSEIEDSIWGDYTLDLSFLSSDDQRSGLDDDDSLSSTKGTNFVESSDQVILKLPEVLIKSSKVVVGDDGDKLNLSCVNKTVLSEKSSDQDDSEEDSPCWRGMHSHKTLGLGANSVTSRRSIDDLSKFHRLNPLAPQFIPSNSKKKLDIDGEICEEINTSSSSLKKSLSSTFPSSSGEFNLSDPPLEDGISSSILNQNADEIFGFVSSDSVSQTVSVLDSRNEFQTSKRLDPLAPVFVPSSSKLSPSVREKQSAFESNALSTSALTLSDDKLLNKVKVDIPSGEVGSSIKIRYSDGVHESGSTSSYNPWIESSKVGITEYEKLGRSSSKSHHGQRKLNPLAPQFSLASSKQKAYSYERNQATDDLSLVVNTAGPTGYWDHNVVDADFAQSSVYVEHLLPNMSPGSSSLLSPKVDNEFGSTKWFAVEPKPTLSVKGNNKALSGPPPKMDVKKLLTTMHGLSELLTHAHGSEPSDSQCVEEFELINSTVQNLNLYIKSNIHDESLPRRSSYDLKLSPNKSKLSIRDLELPRTNNMTVDLDMKRKDKYSMVSRDMVPDSRLYQYGAAKDNCFGQVVAQSSYQQNHQGEEQINQHALFYKSLWLKAEADRCLMVYETSLSNPNP